MAKHADHLKTAFATIAQTLLNAAAGAAIDDVTREPRLTQTVFISNLACLIERISDGHRWNADEVADTLAVHPPKTQASEREVITSREDVAVLTVADRALHPNSYPAFDSNTACSDRKLLG